MMFSKFLWRRKISFDNCSLQKLDGNLRSKLLLNTSLEVFINFNSLFNSDCNDFSSSNYKSSNNFSPNNDQSIFNSLHLPFKLWILQTSIGLHQVLPMLLLGCLFIHLWIWVGIQPSLHMLRLEA